LRRTAMCTDVHSRFSERSRRTPVRLPCMSGLAEAADQLRTLHHGSEPLVLPNAWDAASARAALEAGFPVVATTSSGMSAALGYADGEHTPVDEMFWGIARIARAVEGTPVTADIEAGYGLSPAELVGRLLEAGAVGCNLEDTDHSRGQALRDAEEQAIRLRALKDAASARGVNVVLNARIDVFLRATVGSTLEETIRRGRLYAAAGADCIFPIGAPDEDTIAALVQRIPAPVNVIAGFRGAPGLQRLRELGVRRISYAGRLHRASATDHLRRLEAIHRWEDIY
jgi:2-methylisocitrate lyase-like PEP mutase family enzyme